MQSLLDKFVKPENAVKQFLIQLDKKKPTTKESLSGSHGSVVMMRYIAYCQKKLRTALIKSTSPQSAEALRTNDKGDIILSTQ